MKHPQLTVEKREVLGKNVKKLRREGLLPANVYGKGLASVAIQVKTDEFKTIYKEVGDTGLIDVMLDGTRHPVLVKNLQMTYPLRVPLHVDFFQVNLKEKVKTMVQLVVTGEPKAVTEKIGLLLQTLSEVEVEALPEELPENIEVNVENLAALDEQITVADLKVPAGVTILTDGGQTIAKIVEPVQEEPEEPAPDEEAAAGEEGEDGAAEGDEKKDETTDAADSAKEE